jgi:hypothetical protein
VHHLFLLLLLQQAHFLMLSPLLLLYLVLQLFQLLFVLPLLVYL